MAALPGFYQEYTQVTGKLSQLSEQADQLDRERKGLITWFKLLKESDQIYKSLSTMPDLRARLTDELVRDIRRNFTQRGLDALAEDAEHFRAQFDEITRERDSRVAAGHEAFGEVKQRYRNWLAAMGVERSDFPAHYSPVEHELSYEDMYQQAKSLAVGHLDHSTERFKSLDLDLRKARRIHFQKLTQEERTTLADLERQRANLQAALNAAREWLLHVDLAQAEDLDEQAKSIAGIGQTLDEVDKAIRGLILRPILPQTPEEQKVMSLLSGRRDADLTELVLSAGDELDLTGLVTGLVGLYQGNQIAIKVQKRA